MIENSIVYKNFRGKYDYFPLAKTEGSFIWDRKGKRYIDFIDQNLLEEGLNILISHFDS